jgi:glycerophosphoryl diester phosphodiesterase
MSQPVEIVCHKGANKLAPENTLAAAGLCVDWGMDYVEIDVHTSSDGVLYIFHGPNLQRTTNGKGWIGSYSAAELDRLDAGSWFSPAFTGEPIPRLEPFLHWIKGKAKIFLDVKNADPCQLAELIYATGFEQDCFFWSHDEGWMQRLHELYPRLALKVNVRTPGDAQTAWQEFGARYVETGLENVTPELLSVCHGLGMRVMVLYAGNDPEIFRQILVSGADMINTDYGNEFLAVMQGL